MEFCLFQKGHLHDTYHLMACFSVNDMSDIVWLHGQNKADDCS